MCISLLASRQLLEVAVRLLPLAISQEDRLSMHLYRSASCLPRAAAAELLDASLLPAVEKGVRLQLCDGPVPGQVVAGSDPVLFETYGEFPLSSLDTLLDRAEELLPTSDRDGPLSVVDLGSGCGRLALYLALSRPSWDVHGIEISPALHRAAVEAAERGAAQGCLIGYDGSSTLGVPRSSRLTLHHGPAADFSELLQSADIIFCYSTAFESCGFSEQATAMVLGRDWNELLTSNVRLNRLCITTDKALDPSYGWRILDRIDVPNPEVFESTGFIQLHT